MLNVGRVRVAGDIFTLTEPGYYTTSSNWRDRKYGWVAEPRCSVCRWSCARLAKLIWLAKALRVLLLRCSRKRACHLQLGHVLVQQHHAVHLRGAHGGVPLRAALAAAAAAAAASIATQPPCTADL
jgi:hypothetical protein